jgi:lysosomal-associated membrane protein 1/2
VYKDDNNATQTVHEIVPTTATSSGTCADDEVSVTITGGNVTLTLTFSRNKTSQQSALSEIEVNVTLPNLSNVAVTLENQTLFEAPLNKSYKCTKETSVKLGDEVNLRVASLQVEAFRQTAFDNYSAALECAIDDVSPVVPLAVGISLAVLVVIVLIAYLIGRSRSRARGYQSV